MLLSRKNRATDTLYVGNLAFNTTKEDLKKGLADKFRAAIFVEKITIPCVNGKSRYGFIELSWAHSAKVDIADLIKIQSGTTSVNEWMTYFRELREKGNN